MDQPRTDPRMERMLAGEHPSAYLDAAAEEPLYRQVRAFVEDSIERGVFVGNRPLPSSRFLAQELGVSRNTVTTAYDELMALGAIESRPRSGLYVSQLDVPARRGARPAGPGATSSLDWAARTREAADADLPAPLQHPQWTSSRFPFISGQPDLRSFPARGWLRALSDALAGPHAAYSLRDAGLEDDPLLVDVLCSEVLPRRGVEVMPHEVLVTNGSQQALSLLAATLLRPGSTVAVEDPGYLDLWHILRRQGARLAPVPVDRHGIDLPPDLRPDAVYVTPSHQHPTNVTLSLPRRKELLRRAQAQEFFIIEDDYDSEFRFRGRPTPSLKSLDRTGHVIYVGSFSKFLAPGLRMGFVVAPAPVIAAMRAERQYLTKSPSAHTQRALGLFIHSGEYHKVLRARRLKLKRNWETLVRALAEHMPYPVDGGYPPGGLFVWERGPAGLDGDAVVEHARTQGILLDGGTRQYLRPDPPTNALRIGFGAIRREAIEPGVRQLAAIVKEHL